MKRKKKFAILLLELLVAFSLLAICLPPLISSPKERIQQDQQRLLALRMRHDGETLLCYIEELLRTEQISWDTLISATPRSYIPLDPPQGTSYACHPMLNIQPFNPRKIDDTHTVLLVWIHVSFADSPQHKLSYKASRKLVLYATHASP